MRFYTFFTLLLLTGSLHAQTPLHPILTHDAAGEDTWVTEGNVSITSDGTATGTPNWNGRLAIASVSGNAAVLLEQSAGEVNTVYRSPFLDFSGETTVYLSFHQYYRNFLGNTSIVIRDDGFPIDTIRLNEALAQGVETAHFDTVLLDLSTQLGGQINHTVEFVFAGQGYFWLLDDIAFYNGPAYARSKPDTMSNFLFNLGYPFAIDSAEWTYVPEQLVVQFPEGTPLDTMQDIREGFGAKLVKSCACGFIELWEIDGSLFSSQGGTRENFNGTIDIFSNKLGAKRKSRVDGVDLNYYTGTQLIAQAPQPSLSLTSADIRTLNPARPNSVRIAILDTGIDYDHPRLRRFMGLGPDLLETRVDEDNNCLNEDIIGWNYVDDNNNPYDDNSHGTHVAGIIADSLIKYGDLGPYQFRAYKTHDNNGVSTLFDVACGTFQASIDRVDVINDSWGFFGDSSVVLSNALDTAAARNVLVISAAGNDGLFLDTLPQYPACYAAPNVITVAATGTDPNLGANSDLADFSNFGANFVDVLAPGEDINSTIPDGLFQKKSGTSMAAPMVTASAAMLAWCLRDRERNGPSFGILRDRTLGISSRVTRFQNYVNQGRFLDYYPDCPTATPVSSPSSEYGFAVSPNPFGRRLRIRSEHFTGRANLRLVDATGRVIYRQKALPWSTNESQSITLPELPAGMYFLQISGPDWLWTEKLLRF